MSHRVVLSLGSNLDDPVEHLRRAVGDLGAEGVRVLASSHVHRTAPVGYADQPDFCNATLLATTDLGPQELLAACHRVEAAHDRRRLIVNGPRTLDVDVITVDQLVRHDADRPPLLPHPRAHERAFVLVPWLEVDPDAELPGHGRVADLPAASEQASAAAGVRRTEEKLR